MSGATRRWKLGFVLLFVGVLLALTNDTDHVNGATVAAVVVGVAGLVVLATEPRWPGED